MLAQSLYAADVEVVGLARPICERRQHSLIEARGRPWSVFTGRFSTYCTTLPNVSTTVFPRYNGLDSLRSIFRDSKGLRYLVVDIRVAISMAECVYARVCVNPLRSSFLFSGTARKGFYYPQGKAVRDL